MLARPAIERLRLRLPLLWVAPLLFFDQRIKSWALEHLANGESLPLLPPILQLTLVENRGMVFGLLPEQGDVFTVLAIVVAGWLWFAYPRIATRRLERIGAVLVLGGALSNALDRLRYGFVVDFVHVEIPGLLANVSNFADHALVLGAMLWLICATQRPQAKMQREGEG
ncbi:MAG: signal peptidase II [Anaerolineaceae bacterium]|nr:signal peptidase II [Anaerolineaceae bacterium]